MYAFDAQLVAALLGNRVMKIYTFNAGTSSSSPLRVCRRRSHRAREKNLGWGCRFLRGPLMRVPLDNIRIAAPCSSDWKSMAGDDRVRFCSHCKKHVYSLSALTTHQAIKLLEEKQGNVCVQFVRRWNGTIWTSDCGAGFRQLIRHPVRWWIGSLMAILALVLPGCGGRTLGAPVPTAANKGPQKRLEEKANDQPLKERDADNPDMKKQG